MLTDKIKARGEVSFVLVDQYGNVKESATHNMVVNTGLSYITSRMKDTTSNVMSHMAVGDTNTAAAKTQTALAAASELARVALTSTTVVTTSTTNDSIQYVATFNPGTGTGAIVEAGIFNAASAGTMLARTVFGVINKGALDTLTLTWKIVVA